VITLKAYKKIQELEIKEFIKKTDLHEVKISIICIVFLIVQLFLAPPVWVLVRGSVHSSRKSWRQMMHQIPLEIYISNRLLRTYLKRNCDGKLNSIAD